MSNSNSVVPAIPRVLQAKFADQDWGADQLQAVTMFKAFSRDELKELYTRGTLRIFKAGSHVVIEGENTRGIFLLFNGGVSVLKTEPRTGKLHRIANLDEGAAIGEFSLFNDCPRSATVKADQLCYIFELDFAVFSDFLTDHGSEIQARFYKTCAEDLSEKFRIINADYINSQQLLWKYALRK